MTEAELLSKITAALVPVDPPTTITDGRFALHLAGNVDAHAFTTKVEKTLASLSPTVHPLSSNLKSVLLLTFPGKILRQQPSTAFEAAYALCSYFELTAAEPELYTGFFNDEPDGDISSAELESLGLKSTCQAPENASLENEKAWAIRLTRTRDAWAYSEAQGRATKGKGIVIAQPDTGITTHPELESVQYATGVDLLLGKEGAIDPLGYVGSPSHGTGTASVAVSPELGFIVGAAPAATLMPIRAIETVVRVSQLRVAEAVDYAVSNGAHIISMSLGGLPSLALWMAIRRAVAANVIVVAAAGNCAKTVVWPARYEDCIAVAGTNFDDLPWKGSCTGTDVDVSAPAENVYRARTELDGNSQVFRVGQGQGTSFATALTAGIAACWLAHHGRSHILAEAAERGESVQQMFKRLLLTTSRRPQEWNDREMGAGIVNALDLLKADLDAGRGEEGAALLNALPTSSIRALTQAYVPSSIGDINLERYGMEMANSILESAQQAHLTDAEIQLESGEQTLSNLSPTLHRVLASAGKSEQIARTWLR